MIFQQIRSTVSPGATLPGTNYIVKVLGKRHGEEALVYRIRSRTSGARPSEKGITKSEFEQAYSQLVAAGRFTREWFEANLGRSAAEAPCNFKAMGGVFVMLGIASYKRGEFTSTIGTKP
jgi:glucokinase